jgi:hypothetical protein
VAERSITPEVGERLGEHQPRHSRGLAVEVLEGLLLAVVAVATAWSGYQSALWDSRSAASYGESSRLRILSQGAQTIAGQETLYDSSTFYAWLLAEQAGNTTLTDILVRRMRPEYKVAFDAWLKLDPLNNPDAPPGPAFMPQYTNAAAQQANKLDAQASAAFDSGNHERDVGDQYVRVTVLLAVVLFLTAISQRFDIRNVRLGVLGLAMLVLGFSIVQLVAISL